MGWPEKSDRTLPGLRLELLMVAKSPDENQSLFWNVSQVPVQKVLPVVQSFAGCWHYTSALRKEKDLLLHDLLDLGGRHS